MAKILKFYCGSGSSEFWVENYTPVIKADAWEKIRHTAIKLLAKRGLTEAADVLEQTGGLGIYEGVNGWHDDFNVLFRQVGIDDYVKYGQLSESSPNFSDVWRQVVRALSELGHPVRFVGVELADENSPDPVSTPTLALTTRTVEHALADAESLVAQTRPVSAVDRAHTALHGYLKQVCSEANILPQASDPSLTELVKVLIKLHPKFANLGPHKDQIEKIFKSMSVTCDALNPIRNHGSLAHANETLLEPAEAMLAINASRTLLHYVDQKLQ